MKRKWMCVCNLGPLNVFYLLNPLWLVLFSRCARLETKQQYNTGTRTITAQKHMIYNRFKYKYFIQFLLYSLAFARRAPVSVGDGFLREPKKRCKKRKKKNQICLQFLWQITENSLIIHLCPCMQTRYYFRKANNHLFKIILWHLLEWRLFFCLT